MSTRSVIARTGNQEGSFSGRYVHCDGAPTCMGAFLWELLRGHFKNDLSKMLTYLIDQPLAQCGWSSIVGKDFNLKPAYSWQRAIQDGASYEVYAKRADYRRPQCFAGRPGETPYLFTEKDLDGTDVEWLFVFSEADRKLYVRDVSAKEDVAVIDLDGEQPDWQLIECGEDFSRCSHVAWYHFPELKHLNISTQTYLGLRPFDFHDVIAYQIKGKRYKALGSGGNSDYFNCSSRRPAKPFPSNCWIASVETLSGSKRMEYPVAKIEGREYTPYPGVTWIYPPTKDNPRETEVQP